MKVNIIIFILLIKCNVFGQKIELFGGINKNHFFDYQKNKGHFTSSYDSDYGYSAGFGIDSIKIDWLTLRFTLQFDKYEGKLEAYNGGLGGGNTIIANVKKSLISVGVFPVNFRFFHRLDINIGIVISRLIDESFDGTSRGWILNNSNWSYNLQDKYKQYSSKTYFGFHGKIDYDFKLSKSIWITPQYLYYYGLTNEFVEFPNVTKAMRHYFCLGLKRNLNKKST